LEVLGEIFEGQESGQELGPESGQELGQELGQPQMRTEALMHQVPPWP